jgi:hypothetical protein
MEVISDMEGDMYILFSSFLFPPSNRGRPAGWTGMAGLVEEALVEEGLVGGAGDGSFQT